MMILILWILFASASSTHCFEHFKKTSNLIGSYKPQCTKEGMYQSKQCHGSTGYCWCVTPYGKRRLEPVPPGNQLKCDY